MRLAECRVEFPIQRRNYSWRSQGTRQPSAHFVFRSQERDQLVRDRKKRCALQKRRFVALLPELPPSLGGEAVEDIPGRIDPDHAAVIEFLSDGRVAFAVNFVSGKSANLRTHCAAIQYVLSVLYFNVLWARFNHSPGGVGPGEAVVKVRMIGLILQFARDFERDRVRSAVPAVEPKEIPKPEIGIL